MADAQKDVLYRFSYDFGDAAKRIAEITGKITDLKAQQAELQIKMKNLDTGSDKYKDLARQLAANTEAQKAYRRELSGVSREVQNAVRSDNLYTGSLDAMRARLSTLKQQLGQMTDVFDKDGRMVGKNAEEYRKLSNEIYLLNEQVKQQEQNYGVYSRNVGNYTNSIREAFTGAGGGMAGLGAAAKAGAAPVLAMVTGVASLAKSIMRTREMSRQFEQDTKNLQTILGITNEAMTQMSDSALKLGRTTEYTASQVVQLQTELAKLGFTTTEIQGMQRAVLALATDLNASLPDAAALTGATLRAFGADANEASHYIDVLVAGANKSALSFSAYQTAMAQIAPVASQFGLKIEDTVALLGTLANAGFDASTAATSLRNILTKMSDPDSKLSQALSKPVTDMESLIEGVKELQAKGMDLAGAFDMVGARGMAALTQLTSDNEGLGRLRQQLEDVSGIAKTIEEERLQTMEGSIKKLQSAWEGFVLSVTQSKGVMSGVLDRLANAIATITDMMNGMSRRESIASRAADMIVDTGLYTTEELDAMIAKMEALNRLTNKEETLLMALKNARLQMSLTAQNDAIAAIGGGTPTVTTDTNTAGGSGAGTAKKSASKSTLPDFLKVRDNIDKLALGDTLDYQIAQVQKKFEEAYANLELLAENEKMSADELAYYKNQLAVKEAQEIEGIQQESAKRQTDYAAEQARREVAEKKKLEAQQYNDALQMAWNDAEARYNIRRAYLLKQLQDETLVGAEREKIVQQLDELEAEYNQKRVAELESYAAKVTDMMGSLVTVLNNMGQADVQNYRKQNEEKKKNLKKRLDAGQITEKQYAAESEALQEELDAKELEIQQRAAQRQKVMSAFQIAIDTATAIMRIWADVPKMDFGVSTAALVALATASGAAQLAAVMSQPLPKARKGGRVQGATHEQGGVLIETEGDERIISADPSRAFPELLNLISYIGKHGGGIPQTGYGVRQAMRESVGADGTGVSLAIDYDRLADAIAKQPIFLSLKELREAEQRQQRIVSISRL